MGDQTNKPKRSPYNETWRDYINPLAAFRRSFRKSVRQHESQRIEGKWEQNFHTRYLHTRFRIKKGGAKINVPEFRGYLPLIEEMKNDPRYVLEAEHIYLHNGTHHDKLFDLSEQE